MPTPDEPFRAAVFYKNDEQREQAEAALRAVRPERMTVYSGVAEGWLTRDGYKQLVGDGLLVDLTDPSSPEEVEPEPLLMSSRAATPAEDELEEFKEQARGVALEKGGGLVDAGAAEAEKDPELTPLPVDEAAPVDVYWVRFKRPLSPEQRDDLAKRGLEISAYEPPNTYKMFLTRKQRDELEALPLVESVDLYTFEQTVTPHLVETAVAESDQPQLLQDAAPQLDTFDLVVHRSRDEEKVRKILEQTEGVEDVEASEIFIRFKAPPDAPLLSAIAQLPEVRKLAPYRPPKLAVDHARKLVGVETINNPPPDTWTGAGQLVGIFDSGIDTTHPDLADRIDSAESTVAPAVTDAVGHGSHVAGIIAGTGTASGGAVRGVAPDAKLVVVQITDGGPLDLPPNLGDLLKRATDKGAKIVNLSWGTPVSGDYDTGSLGIDRFICEHPDVLVVVAAGNDGVAPHGYVDMSSVYSPASAKNVITVGASTSDRPHDPELRWGTFRQQKFPAEPTSDEIVSGEPDLIAALSSRGPTDFDSVKPDVLAPGTFILSARSAAAPDKNYWETCADYGGKYAYNGGTSMATPVATGAAAVVRQYLTEERKLPSPSAALIKAILIASAIKIPSPRPPEQQAKVGYPDFDQGFGRIDLSSVLPGPHAPQRRLELVDVANDSPDALESRAPIDGPRKSSKRYSVDVPDGAHEVRIVLTWTDPPSRSVQNNLGLDVSGKDGFRVLGNAEHTFRKDPLFDDPKATGMIFDKRNNVEQVVLTNPVAATYRIRVWAENTAFPPQGYALCVVGDLGGPLQ
jgi:serine protease AprX